ncbi:MAG: hypothetical protein IKD78_05505 [Bacteroidales bacterium]|nr:hypothetical protein [Bacteroidales bacterium]MBR6931093.1 hypothetical protein [Bacteroidales bacterium]
MATKPVTDKRKAWNIAHYRRVNGYSRQIEKLYTDYLNAVSELVFRYGVTVDGDSVFRLSDYPSLKRQVDQLTKELSADIAQVIKDADKSEWTKAQAQAVQYIEDIYRVASLPNNLQALFGIHAASAKGRNLDAYTAFSNRKIGGLSLSNKVWQYTKSLEAQMEASIDIALLEGRSAAKLSRDIRSLLNEPDLLFRRVRDSQGRLRMSRAMKAFSAGRGKYKSAYKNAMRLARTEINMAYRSSDCDMAQNLMAVVGIGVNLSNNHTCNGKPFVDICDELQGNYPKDFIFRGWHPQCRCFITFITKTDEEFWRDLADDVDRPSVNTVKDVPPAFRDWLMRNRERLDNATTKPYFVTDNLKYTSI